MILNIIILTLALNRNTEIVAPILFTRDTMLVAIVTASD